MQRPSVMESVALDLFLMRRLAIFLRQFPQVWLPPDSCACKQTPVELSLPGPAAAACARYAVAMVHSAALRPCTHPAMLSSMCGILAALHIVAATVACLSLGWSLPCRFDQTGRLL